MRQAATEWTGIERQAHVQKKFIGSVKLNK
jgi:hypothetical protein